MMKKMAIASLAVLMLGSSAALAQPYGYANHYVSAREACRNPDRAYDLQQFRTGHMENVPVCVGDPATSMHISEQEYLNIYPWSDRRTWVYNPAMDVWADNTPDRERLFAQTWSNNQGDRRSSRNYSPDSGYRRLANQQAPTCQNPDRAYDIQQYRTGHMENVPLCLGDPATGMHISAQEYLNKYPWSDRRTWVYNPAMDVWADNTPDRERLFAQTWSNNQGDRRYSRNYFPDSRYRR